MSKAVSRQSRQLSKEVPRGGIGNSLSSVTKRPRDWYKFNSPIFKIRPLPASSGISHRCLRESAPASFSPGKPATKASISRPYTHQPSQFEQIVELKISDLPCGTLQKTVCHTANPRSRDRPLARTVRVGGSDGGRHRGLLSGRGERCPLFEWCLTLASR